MTRAYRDPDGGLWLTTSQVAERMQVSPRTVWRYVTQGRFPRVQKTMGNHARIPAADVDRLVAELTHPGGGDQ